MGIVGIVSFLIPSACLIQAKDRASLESHWPCHHSRQAVWQSAPCPHQLLTTINLPLNGFLMLCLLQKWILVLTEETQSPLTQATHHQGWVRR